MPRHRIRRGHHVHSTHEPSTSSGPSMRPPSLITPVRVPPIRGRERWSSSWSPTYFSPPSPLHPTIYIIGCTPPVTESIAPPPVTESIAPPPVTKSIALLPFLLGATHVHDYMYGYLEDMSSTCTSSSTSISSI
ncbi:hypothetical protein CK203_114311 [Vitis vinifera]|uniref:Uncharacterized protein n=1 Tax=Vitis vinifera TaxID=29760 RepID=A0A438C9H1_VITVI|nr:hypothetical protein CK203_114311 [Vitis vinifera]